MGYWGVVTIYRVIKMSMSGMRENGLLPPSKK